jgi:hypothetical protein
MQDQELSGGASAPVTDANASQAEVTTEVVEPKSGSEADSSPAAKDSSEPAKPKDWESDRIKELTRHRREAERRADRLMRENEELRRSRDVRPQPQQPNYAQPQQQISTNPNDIAEIAAQKAQELLREREVAERRAQFDTKVDEFASEVEDYDAVVTDRTPVSAHMAEAIMDSDSPGALLYYLGKNPDVARKLYSLPLTKAAKEIGRIEDRLIAERKKAAEKPVTKAPPPAPQIDAKEPSTRVSTTSPDSDAMTDEEWVKAENARIRRKAQRQAS